MLTHLKRNLLWVIYFIFIAYAFATHSGEAYFLVEGKYQLGKLTVWVIYFLFLIYSLNISRKENFFKSLKRMSPILWTRQIGLDLYIGLLVPLTLIVLHEGTVSALLIWLIPVLIFANLATLVYLGLNFSSLMAYFV